MPDPGLQAARGVRARELFAAAVDLPPHLRADWLSAETSDNPALFAEISALIAADVQSPPIATSTSLDSDTEPQIAWPDATRLPDGRVGHYRLGVRIGEGGMGQVFRAWDLALDRPAAIKLIRPDVGRDKAVRLLREVNASAHLQHPAIATFFEGGSEAGLVYLAMELVEGTTLRQRLADGPLSPTLSLTVLTGLLEALAHAHAAGLLHRDIKPENVMLTAAGHPKLLDFGIARPLVLIDRNIAGTGETVTRLATQAPMTADGAGTPGYMSPEQLRGEVLTPASDVFQAGVLLFEMLTGRPAFGDGPPLSRIAATLAGPPDLTPLSELQPRGLPALVARALAFDPAERFESVSAFLREVDALVDGRLRQALPESLVVAEIEPNRSSRTGAAGEPAESPGNGSHEWLGRALTESLAAQLAHHDDLSVVAAPRAARVVASARTRGEPMDAVRLALALGVRWGVSGRFERDGARVRVALTLYDASTGTVAATSEVAGSLDETLSGPGLADAVLSGLRLDRRGRTDAPVQQARAIELYMLARQLWQSGNRAAHPRVFALIDEIVAAAPGFAPALTLLAAARATSFITSRDPRDLEAAVEAADRAIAIDPEATEAWSWRAYALLRQQRVDEALLSYERATASGRDPMAQYLYGSTLSSLARFEPALPYLQRTVTLEPRHGIGWLSLGWTLHSLLREDAALYALRRARTLEGQPGPTFVAGIGGYIAECLRSLGHVDLAREEALEGLASIERSDHSYRDTIRAFCLCALGRVALDRSDPDGARAAFTQAVAQMRGRTMTLAGGQAFVQALAGLARATGDRTILDEAVGLFETRRDYSFNHFFGCSDDTTAYELAITAAALGLEQESQHLLRRARAAGCIRPFAAAGSPPSAAGISS